MAGSSNFLQWNPGAVNQENDTAYLADTQRSGGATVNSIFTSALANKAFYQWSIFVAAFCQMMANKGFVMSDASYTSLIAALTNVLTTADINFNNIVTVPYSANPVFDASQGQQFYMLLTGNVTGATIINTAPGQRLSFMFKQDGVGSRNFAWPANMFGMGTIGAAANQRSEQLAHVWADGVIVVEGPVVTYP